MAPFGLRRRQFGFTRRGNRRAKYDSTNSTSLARVRLPAATSSFSTSLIPAASEAFASRIGTMSVNPRLRLDVLNVVRERELVHRAVVDLHSAALAAPAIQP